MTNAEFNLSRAVEAMEAGLLTGAESLFIQSIQHYSKKELNGLSSKQFDMLRSIANKYTV